MHNRICSVFASSCVLSIALSLQAQLSQTRAFSPQSPAHPTSQPFVMIPFTAEYKVTTARTKADGTSVSHEEIQMDAHDSRGRAVKIEGMEVPLPGKETIVVVMASSQI